MTWILEPHLIKHLKAKFGEEVMAIQSHWTSGTPRFKIVRSNYEGKIPIASQSQYRSSVRMLLYIIKHSRPDLASVVRELSKWMGGVNIAAYREMIRLTEFPWKPYCFDFIISFLQNSLALWTSQ
jgi:hypothetical protein